MTIGIVILNFLAYQDTIECIDSIKNQSYQTYEIVIVDNDSQNSSYEILQKKYSHESNISIIKAAKNLGFAKGNNLGIAILKEMGIYNILVINGDTLLTQSDYLEKLSVLKLNNQIAMVGTKIMSKDGINQNTQPVDLIKKADISRSKVETFLIRCLYALKVNGLMLKIKKKFQSANEVALNEEVNEPRILNPEKEKLHGAAIYFTESYLKNYIGFYPETFLYFEEEFLALICRQLDFKQLYIEELSIYHKEDASSDKLMNNNRTQAELFKLNIIKRNIRLMDKAMKLSRLELKKG